MKLTKIILVVPIVMLATISYGLSGGELLREPVGARQTAMGEAFTAMDNDINGLYYNVAGLATLSEMQVSTMMALNAFENKTINLSLGLPVDWFGKATIALGLNSLIGPEMTINYLDGSQETINSQTDYLLSIAYAHQLSSALQIGVLGKLFYSNLMDENEALAFAGDLGLIYHFQDVPNLSAGFTLQNVGTDIVYDEEGDPMPTQLRIGAAYKLTPAPGQGVTITADLILPNDEPSLQQIGVEYDWKDMLFVRAGYKLGYELDSLTVGAGIKVSGIIFDYAFSQRKIAEHIHRFGLGYSFGNLKK